MMITMMMVASCTHPWNFKQCFQASTAHQPDKEALQHQRIGHLSATPSFIIDHFKGITYSDYRCSVCISPIQSMIRWSVL
jgi:hypothetical protein